MDQKRTNQIIIALGVLIAITAIPHILNTGGMISYFPIVAGIILVLVGIAGLYKGRVF